MVSSPSKCVVISLMSTSQIQFRYALDENGNVVSIDDVPIEYSKRGRYYFPGTEAEMIARKGKKVAWHFAHKDGNPGALETYLHNTGKYLFKQVFEAAEKFTISLPAKAVCVHSGECPVEERYPCHFHDYTSFDLKKYYDKCEIEKDYVVGEETFRPDVLLVPKNPKHPPVFVEVFVSHESTYEKRNSGAKIIEIKLESEEDFRLIEKCHISSAKKIKLYGFDAKKEVRRDRVADKKLIFSLRAEGDYGFIYHDDCFSRCSQDDWYSKNDDFAIFYDTQGYRMDDSEVIMFLHRKALDYGHDYYYDGKIQDTMSDEIVDEHFDSYYIYQKQNGPSLKQITESRDGYNVLMGGITDFDLPGSTYSKEERRYWHALARVYDNLREFDLDEDRLYQAAYLAAQRHKYIRIIKNPRYRKPQYDFQRAEHREYIPALVDTVPSQLIEDRSNDWLFSL